MTEHKATLLFDFDGTLADTFGLQLDITNQLFSRYRRPTLTLEQAQQQRDLSAREWVAFHHIPLWFVPALLYQGRQLLKPRLAEVKMFPQMEQVICDLSQAGYQMGIVSSNRKDYIKATIPPQTQMQFSFIESERNIWGKAQKIRKLLRQQRLNPHTTLYIGDEARDVLAAHQAGIACIAVSWGFNSADRLAQETPAALVHNPDELYPAIEELLP